MTIQTALGTYLSGYAGLAALVGSRVYAVQAVQEAVTPYVVYRFDSRVDIQSLDMPSPGKTGQARVQISTFDGNYDVACAVAEQIRQALSGFQGSMGGTPGVDVQHCLLVDMHDEDVSEFRLFEVYSLYDVMFAIEPTNPLPS